MNEMDARAAFAWCWIPARARRERCTLYLIQIRSYNLVRVRLLVRSRHFPGENMNTCHNVPVSSPRGYLGEIGEWTVAERFAVDNFANDVRRRMPDREMFTQLSHLGIDSGFQAPQAGPTLYPWNKTLTAVSAALASEFKNWINRKGNLNKFGHRKPDALAVSSSQFRGELLEVCTVSGKPGTILEQRDKLGILNGAVNAYLRANHGFEIRWEPTQWQPAPDQRTKLLSSDVHELRWVCLEPTFRGQVAKGLVVYEIHSITKARSKPLPVQLRDELHKRVSDGVRVRPKTQVGMQELGQAIRRESPAMASGLREQELALGLVAMFGAMLLMFTPIVGDEMLCASLAMSLLAARD